MESYLRRMPGWLLTGIGVVLAFWLGFFGVVAWWHWRQQPNDAEKVVAAESAVEMQVAPVPQSLPRMQAPVEEVGGAVNIASTERSLIPTNPGDQKQPPMTRLGSPAPNSADPTNDQTWSAISGTEAEKTSIRPMSESAVPVHDDASIEAARHQWHAWQQANRWVLIVRRSVSKASLEKEQLRLQSMVPSGLELLLVSASRGNNQHQWLLVLGPFENREAARSTVFELPVPFLSEQMDLARASAIRWK